MFTLKKMIGTACLTAPLLLAGAANATIVDTWDYELNSGFTEYDPQPGVTGSGFNAKTGGVTLLSWGTPVIGQNPENDGDPFVQSSFGVDNGGTATGSIATNGATVDTSIYTHQNWVVNEPTWETATLRDILTLDPTSPDLGGAFDAPELSFAIQFFETPNWWGQPDKVIDCPPGVPSDGGCGDIFVLDVTGAGFNPDTLSFIQLFPYADELYAASIFLTRPDGSSGLIDLSAETCAAAGASENCVGMVTAENQANSFQASFNIAHIRSIPEPGVLALMALGLLAMGGLQRKRAS